MSELLAELDVEQGSLLLYMMAMHYMNAILFQFTDKEYLDKTDTLSGLVTNSSNLYLNNNGDNKLYTIVLYLAGQQASGVQALLNLQCRAHSLELPMVILEPIIPQNKFKALPPLHFNESGAPQLDLSQLESVMSFSDLFDLEMFNKMSSEMDYAPLIPRESFFERAPRKIVLVVLFDEERNELPEIIRLWPKHGLLPDSCFDPLTSHLSNDPKYQIYQIIQKGFCVIKVVLFQMTRGKPLIFTEAQLRRSILGRQSYTDITLVFNVWMPKFVMPGSKGSECINSGYHSSKEQLQPSKRLLANAKYYEDHFLKSGRNSLTLMIRLEHIYTFLRRPKRQYEEWTVEKCLNAAKKEIQEFHETKSFSKPFVTLDIGKYGSKSLSSAGLQKIKNDTELINKFLLSLYDGEWNLKEWEESFVEATGGIEDSSYVAALQRTLASKAECLILVGGGMFQELTVRNYMSTHDKADWCIHYLCIKDKKYIQGNQSGLRAQINNITNVK